MSGLVVDASAVVAMLESEPEAAALRTAFLAADRRLISSVGAFECAIVLGRRRGLLAVAGLELFLSQLEVEVVPFDDTQRRVAQLAYERFGKGRHPAALNLGDCCAYAAARVHGLPLLQKGEDFPRSDLEVVRW